MNHFRLLLFLTTLILAIHAAKRKDEKTPMDPSKDVLFSVEPRNEAEMKILWELQSSNTVDLWNGHIRNEIAVIMRVKGTHVREVKNELKKKKMKFRVLNSSLPGSSINQVNELNQTDSKAMKYFNVYQYHTLKDIEGFLKYITKTNKNVSRIFKMGESFEKRPLHAVKISVSSNGEKSTHKSEAENQKSSTIKKSRKKLILLECGMHSREWAAMAFCVYFINQLIFPPKEDRKLKEVLNKYDFIIIPVINPDGYVYSYTKDRFWRKTRSINPESPKCVGVDGNRNFGGCDDKNPCSSIYCGKKPFSEPETDSLNCLLKKITKKLKAFFSIHSYGQFWLLPWGKTADETPKNFKEMKRVADIGAESVKKAFGTQFKVGMISKLLYAAQGTSVDYVLEKGFAKYSYALELGDPNGQPFVLPADQLPKLCEETKEGLVAAILAMK